MNCFSSLSYISAITKVLVKSFLPRLMCSSTVTTAMIQPDISVICQLDRLVEKGVYGAPDFCIEIVSPSSRSRDYIKKVSKYQIAGVREYWIVDPKRETVLCYFFEGEDYPQMFTFDDIIPVMIYDGKLEINFADIKDRLI